MLAFMALQLGGEREERAVDGGAIVICQLNNACLDDETAEFDQVSGALASLDLPVAHVMPSQSRLPAILSHPIALEQHAGCA